MLGPTPSRQDSPNRHAHVMELDDIMNAIDKIDKEDGQQIIFVACDLT